MATVPEPGVNRPGVNAPCSWCSNEGCRMCRPASLPPIARHVVWTLFGARHESRLTRDMARSAVRETQRWLWMFDGKQFPKKAP